VWDTIRLITELCKILRCVVREGLLAQLDRSKLARMEGLSLHLPLLLQAIHNILVAPANFVRETLDCAVLPARLQSQHPQSLRHDHPLLTVVGWRNTLEQFQALESRSTTSGLVRNHAPNSAEKNLGGCTVVKGTGLLGVDDMAFVEEIVVSELVTEEAPRDVDFLTPDHNDFLARKDLLGDYRSQPAKEMAFAINYDGAGRERGHGESLEYKRDGQKVYRIAAQP